MIVTRTDIVNTARLALGTPWHHQGRHVPMGIDCAGLIIWTGQMLGLLDANFKSAPYTKTAQWNEFLMTFRANMDEIHIPDARPGDALIFRQNVFPCHCGIMTEEGDAPRFIHSYIVRHKVTEESYTPTWRGNTRAAFRYRTLKEADNG